MSIEEKDIVLTREDIEKIKKTLLQTKFEDFNINSYFYRDKFTGTLSSVPRHNMNLEEVRKIYNDTDSIKYGFKRKNQRGYTYTLCYDESKNIFVKIGYLFDKEPKEIFMAMRIFRKLEKAILKRYGLRI
jgi:hypothetical protein